MKGVLSVVFVGCMFCLQPVWAEQAEPVHGRVAALLDAHQIDWPTVQANSGADAGLVLQFLTRGERGSEAQILHDLRRERVQIAALSMQSLLPLVPELNIALAPYLFASDEEAQFVFDNYLLNTIADLLAAQNLLLIQWLGLDWQGIYSTAPIKVPAALRGMRLGGRGNLASALFFAEFGADFFKGSDFAQQLTARQSLDGWLCNVRTSCFRSAPATETAQLLLTKHSYDVGVMVANKHWFDGVDRQQQEALLVVLNSGTVQHNFDDGFTKQLERDPRVAELSAAQLHALREVSNDLLPRLVERVGGSSARVWEVIQAGKRAYAASHRALEPGSAR